MNDSNSIQVWSVCLVSRFCRTSRHEASKRFVNWSGEFARALEYLQRQHRSFQRFSANRLECISDRPVLVNDPVTVLWVAQPEGNPTSCPAPNAPVPTLLQYVLSNSGSIPLHLRPLNPSFLRSSRGFRRLAL